MCVWLLFYYYYFIIYFIMIFRILYQITSLKQNSSYQENRSDTLQRLSLTCDYPAWTINMVVVYDALFHSISVSLSFNSPAFVNRQSCLSCDYFRTKRYCIALYFDYLSTVVRLSWLVRLWATVVRLSFDYCAFDYIVRLSSNVRSTIVRVSSDCGTTFLRL